VKLWPVLLFVAASVLAAVAFLARDPSYVAPTADEGPPLVPHEVTGAVPAGFELLEFEVDGMCCYGCGGKLYARLTELEGVREAAVDTVRGRAEVIAASSSDPAEVTRALTFDKYTARLAE